VSNPGVKIPSEIFANHAVRLDNSPSFLKEDGVYVNIGDFTHGLWKTMFYWAVNYLRPVWLGGTPRKWIMFGPQVGPEGGVWLQKLVAEEQVKAVIGKSITFDQLLQVSLSIESLSIQN
jgi:hypothetical protein